MELVEKWLDEYVKATTKLCSGVNGKAPLRSSWFSGVSLTWCCWGTGLEGLVSNYVVAGNPVGVSESLMDHDYTLLALTRYAEGSKEFWGAVITGAQKMEQSVVEPLLAFQRKDMKTFKVGNPETLFCPG